MLKTMHLRKPHRGVLALALVFASSSAFADKTLWLVRPLYPGQETLVSRTEAALDKLMVGGARGDAVIGQNELRTALQAVPNAALPCFSVESRCADPIDAFVAGLGFERIVLIQGGQDEAGFKYKVVSYDPKTGRVNPASASNANLEKALLGAVAKVVPAASTLDVTSTPPGATVFIDDVKVGVTPLNTQVLPGERVVRIDLKLHQPIEETVVIPIRGAASLAKALDKVAARIVITASPPGAEILIDGTVAGKDKVDRGIAPGDHTIRLTAENHKSFEQTISVKADQQYSLDKTLEPTSGAKGTDADWKDANAAVVKVEPPAPPKPATPEDLIYERRSYFHVSFEVANMLQPTMVGRRFESGRFGRSTSLTSPGRTLVGASIEYGTFGKYFGMTVFGASYLTNVGPWAMKVGYTPGESRESVAGVPGPTDIDNVTMHLAVIRALHPQFRLAVWRFQFSLQLGLEFRTGNITGRDAGLSTVSYRDGFVPLELLAAGRLNVRFFIVDGLFAHLQGNYTHYIVGERATDETGASFGSSSTFGFNGGIGYGF